MRSTTHVNSGVRARDDPMARARAAGASILESGVRHCIRPGAAKATGVLQNARMASNPERYPADLTVTVEDFRACGWIAAVEGAARDSYSSMGEALAAAARKAVEAGQLAHGKVLWLLADACSMMLEPSSSNQPFRPFAVMGDRRSAIPEDFAASDLALFAAVAAEVDDSRLRARLADLCWLLMKPRRPDIALLAIDAYRGIRLDQKDWIADGRKCWSRAISLARMLGAGAGERLTDMEAALVGAFDAAPRSEGFFALQVADLLAEYNMGRGHASEIANALEESGRQSELGGNYDRARSHFEAAQNWFRTAGDEAKSVEMTVGVAEAWAKEAAVRSTGSSPSQMAAATFYENAIQCYRGVPRKHRAAYQVDARLAQLHALLSEAGAKALGEMAAIRTPGVDITELVEKARDEVRGKPPLEALRRFANLYGGVNVKAIRENVLQSMRDHPLQALFASTRMGSDGRVVAKRPAMGFGEKLSESDEAAIGADMQREYGILVSLVVQGDIMPALHVLLAEHRLTQGDFIVLARQSPIVPKDRAGLFGRALFAGYDLDFITSIHLLVPQIEHMVRVHLKAAGARTSNIDKAGIENENGLSTLMELPEVQQVFEENLAFELRALFCDPFGPNLRNVLAHGLLDEDACSSIYAIYAWWFALKLVFNTFWNAHRKQDASADPASSPGETAP